MSEIRQRVFEPLFLSLSPRSLSVNHGGQLLRSAVDIVIENHVLKILLLLNLSRRPAQSFLQFRRRICPARYQSLSEQLKGWRQNEDRYRSNNLFANAGRSLHINFENNVVVRGAFAFNLRLAGAVQIAVDIRPFQELTPPDHFFERCSRNKKIFTSVL